MPTYEYACKSCSEHLEVVQSFRDEPLSTCPTCGGELRKVFGSIGITFKGSGFYKTDSRPARATSGSSSGSSTSSSDKSASSSGSSSGSSGGSSSGGSSSGGSSSGGSSSGGASSGGSGSSGSGSTAGAAAS